MRHFRLDSFAHIPRERCTVEALRDQAKDVDLSPHSAGGKPPSHEPGRFVTTQDVTTQLASVYATPAE